MRAAGSALSPEADDTAAQLRGFGPVGLAAIVVILAGAVIGPPMSAALILIWARLSKTPWPSLGFRVPRRWGAAIAGGIAVGGILKVFLKAVVMPIFGAPDRNAPYQFLVGNTAALPGMLAIVLFSAGVAEEIFFRAYLFERLGRVLGGSRASLAAIVVLTTSLFALAHYQGQGVPGVEQAAVTGAVFALMFARWKQIWIVMIAHASFDVAAVMLIYLNWEAPVAHLVFK